MLCDQSLRSEDGDTPQHEAGGGRAAAARPRPRQPLQGGGCGHQVRQQLAADVPHFPAQNLIKIGVKFATGLGWVAALLARAEMVSNNYFH